jgi:hypothetical protein
MAKAAPARTPTVNTPLPAPDDGQTKTQTIGDYIIEQLTAGVDPLNAALAAGITPTEYAAWIREGALVQARLDTGADWHRDFTPLEQDLAWFAGNARRAHGQHVAKLLVVAEQVARGGLVKRETRRKRQRDPQGQLVTVEEWVTESNAFPDPGMLQWKIAALAPDVYGKRAALDITMHDDTDTTAVQSLVAERIQAVIDQFTPTPPALNA